ncbi:MAG: Scr1 family TA system antitoxin-like transcriptional regulator [Pseudonocardiaceae bacterium]
MERLVEAGALPTVSIRVMPIGAGLHHNIMSGPFVMLRFPLNRTGQETEPPTVYVESFTRHLAQEQPQQRSNELCRSRRP